MSKPASKPASKAASKAGSAKSSRAASAKSTGRSSAKGPSQAAPSGAQSAAASARPPASAAPPSALKAPSATAAQRETRVITPERTDTSLIKDNPSADLRTMRRIIAEDPEWSLSTVPLLSELCLKHVVDNFEFNCRMINRLDPERRAKVLEKIPTRVPLKIIAHLIHEEAYWKRCCRERWKVCDVKSYGCSWKSMYFQRLVEEIIENFVPGMTDETRLNETLALAARYVKCLDIRQLLPPIRSPQTLDELSEMGTDMADEADTDHFDFSPVFHSLNCLVELHLTYGVRDCGMNFEWKLFQFTAKDCVHLAKCVAECRQLKVLHLHRSRLDDDKVRIIISHMLTHPGIEELNFEHNQIGDRGARAIGKFVNGSNRIVRLNLCDNQIRAPGALALAHAVAKNTSMRYFNIRLNRLGDDGGQALCRALLKNSTLVDVDMSSNDLTEPTAALLAQVLLNNASLATLNVSCNRLGMDGGKQLQEGMENNRTMLFMDLRLTDCGQESEYCINQILQRNQEAARTREEAERVSRSDASLKSASRLNASLDTYSDRDRLASAH